jgi:hypothetical protein
LAASWQTVQKAPISLDRVFRQHEVILDERLPWHALTALRCRLKSLLGKDALDGRAINLVTQVSERVAQARVSPSRILRANWTISSWIERAVGGRPGRRLLLPSYLAAMSFRYHRKIVSGVAGW